ncbi:MAG: YicC family protein [SAR324 cluster bacterium]|nr:YicC family protein [SAR324 cluster bacterium]MCZ6556192.1 YicC family protein [SAR324 cluster bacterium]MCZ6626974.1 YicC family protein [SAR324 cluster bacterium]MCZ6645518.1 YicC family protein [SAR324 cluster bacterium]MCZ6728582.1 YicC family protein [SAR324 cluster bacterium]
MIRSMTGFGRAQQTEGNLRCSMELRSVNSRFMEIRMKLPGGLAHLEEPLKNIVKKNCTRGKIDCTVTLTPENSELGALALNKSLVQQYARLLEAFQEELGIPIQVTLGNLSNIKDLILLDQWNGDGEGVQSLLEQCLSTAVAELVAMREREGTALQAELKERILAIRGNIAEIVPLIKNIPEQYAQRLRGNLKRLMDSALPSEDRILQEIAMLADRCDVSEELTRIETHLRHLEQMLSEGGVVGRKFEFLLQEVNREANTLAAKSNEVPVSARVVEIKSDLERLREQVQNIE